MATADDPPTLEQRGRRQWKSFPWASPRRTIGAHRLLISVVLPVFNHTEYLLDSVKSVLDQEGLDLELLVVDDGSDVPASETLASVREDSRLKIIRQENAGIAAALNRGFREARGHFVTWTSADNRYLPGALQAMAEFLLANPSVGLVYANVRLIDEHSQPLLGSQYRPQDHNSPGAAELLLPYSADTLIDFGDNFINACFLYRRSLQDVVGGYRGDLPGYEDYDYWMRLSLCSRVAHLDSEEVLYEYRLHSNSLTEKTRRRLARLKHSPCR